MRVDIVVHDAERERRDIGFITIVGRGGGRRRLRKARVDILVVVVGAHSLVAGRASALWCELRWMSR